MIEQKQTTLYALKIALPYLLVSIGWILLSDRFLESTVSDVRALTVMQTYKGFFFVTMSAIMIYLTARHYLDRLSNTDRVIHARDLALSENQQGMFTMLSNLPGMAYQGYNDQSRHMDFVSDGCVNLLEYDSNDFAGHDGMSYAHIIVDEDREMVKHEINRSVRDKQAFQLEYRIRTKTGAVKWVSEQGCAIHSVAGREKVLVGYIFELDDTVQRGNRHRRSQSSRFDSATNDLSPAQDVNQGMNVMSRRL